MKVKIKIGKKKKVWRRKTKRIENQFRRRYIFWKKAFEGKIKRKIKSKDRYNERPWRVRDGGDQDFGLSLK
jgi:hypothetical protein